jgi:hypothetical protein
MVLPDLGVAHFVLGTLMYWVIGATVRIRRQRATARDLAARTEHEFVVMAGRVSLARTLALAFMPPLLPTLACYALTSLAAFP